MKSNNYALYYPTIEFQNYQWLWYASLIWDRIYRVVPDEYQLDEPINIQKLQEEGEIGIRLSPDRYIEKTAKSFMKDIDLKKWDAAALTVEQDDDYIRLHDKKVDVQLRKILIERGTAKANGKWLSVPTEFGAIYMTYLAKTISELNDLQLLSDLSTAWTSATYFKYDGKISYFPDDALTNQLATLVIRDFIPENILDIEPKALLRIRRDRVDERHNFVNMIKKHAEKLSNCKDPRILNDLVRDLKKEIEKSLKDFRKSMDSIHVTGWTGMKSLSFPVLTAVGKVLFPLDQAQLSILAGSSIALGIITGIDDLSAKKRRLSRESDYSYLMHLSRNWSIRPHSADYCYKLNRQIEEYIND